MGLIAFHTENPNRSSNIAAAAVGTAGILAGVALPVMKLLGIEMPGWKCVSIAAGAVSSTSLAAASAWIYCHSEKDTPTPPPPHKSWDEIQRSIQEVDYELALPNRPTSDKGIDGYIQEIKEQRGSIDPLLPTSAEEEVDLDRFERYFTLSEAIVDLLLEKHRAAGLSDEEIGRLFASQSSEDTFLFFELSIAYWNLREGVYLQTEDEARKEHGLSADYPVEDGYLKKHPLKWLKEGPKVERFYLEGTCYNRFRERYNLWCARWQPIVSQAMLTHPDGSDRCIDVRFMINAHPDRAP